MFLAELIKAKRFRIIFLSMCLATGIYITFYQNRRFFSNALRTLQRVVPNIESIGNWSRLTNCSLLTLGVCGDRVNGTENINTQVEGNVSRLDNRIALSFTCYGALESIIADKQDVIFKQFKYLNDSYTLRLSQLKVVTFEQKKNFITVFPPSTHILANDTVGSNDTKLILLWTKFFGIEHWMQTSQFETCQSRCVVTTKKEDLSNSSALIMHGRDISRIQDLPKTRQPHQRWVYMVQESPPHVFLNLKEFNGIWNMTYTYRSDSDIDAGYSGLSPHNVSNQLFQEQLNNILKSKQKLVAARISNCGQISSSRIAYIRELQKHIEVDFYGVCGDKQCPKGGKGCEADLMKQYKFILAFENSNCRDYITEKFWTPLLSWDSVPVVMGGAGVDDYLRVAPPYSFIHVGGFESPKQLAEYLIFMNDHPDYHALLYHWRQCQRQEATGRLQDSLCAFCDLLHNSSAYGQSYTDFKGWYNQDVCKHD